MYGVGSIWKSTFRNNSYVKITRSSLSYTDYVLVISGSDIRNYRSTVARVSTQSFTEYYSPTSLSEEELLAIALLSPDMTIVK